MVAIRHSGQESVAVTASVSSGCSQHPTGPFPTCQCGGGQPGSKAWLCGENQWSLAQSLGWDIPHYHDELLGIGGILEDGWLLLLCLVIFVGHGCFTRHLIASWSLSYT